MAVEWYYAVDGVRHGPVAAKDLKSLADTHKIRPEDLVWKTGLKEWVTAEQVTGLFGAAEINPAEPSELCAAQSSPLIQGQNENTEDSAAEGCSPTHHSDENQQKKLGEKPYRSNSSQSECPNCRSPKAVSEKECRTCGVIFERIKDRRNTKFYWDTFIHHNSAYYFSQFTKFKTGSEKKFRLTWNWCAFLFADSWLLYRKLYWWALADYFAFFLCLCLMGIFPSPYISLLLDRILVGCVGNYLYFRRAEKVIEHTLNKFQAGATGEIMYYLKRKGSYNIWAPLAAKPVLFLALGLIGMAIN